MYIGRREARILSVPLWLLVLYVLLVIQTACIDGPYSQYLSFETNSSLSSSILLRLPEAEWNRRYASLATKSGLPCNTLKLMPWGTVARATSFCYNGLISYESCRKQLLLSDNCNGLIYTDWDVYKGKKFQWWRRGMGTCRLFDRSDFGVQVIVRKEGYDILTREFDNNSYVILKNVPAFDNCSEFGPVGKSLNVFAIDNYKSCLLQAPSATQYVSAWSDTRWFYPSESALSQLPKLNIIIFVTEPWLEKHRAEMDVIASHFQCYATAHDYGFTLSVLPEMTVVEFFLRRHQYAVDKFLPKAQSILVIDGGTNLIFSTTPDIQCYSDRYSVQLQFRENGEIMSGIYLIHNDAYTVCFMQYWFSLFAPSPPDTEVSIGIASIIDNPNSDNGALVAALANFALVESEFPDKYDQCLKSYPPGLHTYPEQHCLTKSLSVIYNTMGPGRKQLNFPGRIRIWWHREGFWRTALPQRDSPSVLAEKQVFDNLYTICYPSSDLIGHGSKQYDKDMLEPYQSIKCNISRVLDSVEGRNPRCSWLSKTEELVLLRRHCQWRSPGCKSDKINGDRNMCFFIPGNVSGTWIRNPECKSSTSTVAFVEGTEEGTAMYLKP